MVRRGTGRSERGQLTLGFSPLAAAVTQAPFAVGIIIGSVVSGAGLGRRYGRPVL